MAVCQYVGMVCVYCSSPTQVTNSRLQRRSNHIWRRRKCLACGSIFTTSEHPELTTAFMVAGAAGKLKPFSRDQLFITIYQSCKHRPTAVGDATALTDTVLGHLLAGRHDGTIKRDTIVRITHQALKRFDLAAATFYAAYHPLAG